MPADIGTQRQQHEYVYDTCCVLTADRYQVDVFWCVCRVSLFYDYSTNNVFKLLPSLLPPMTCVKSIPDGFFSDGQDTRRAPRGRRQQCTSRVAPRPKNFDPGTRPG